MSVEATSEAKKLWRLAQFRAAQTKLRADEAKESGHPDALKIIQENINAQRNVQLRYQDYVKTLDSWIVDAPKCTDVEVADAVVTFEGLDALPALVFAFKTIEGEIITANIIGNSATLKKLLKDVRYRIELSERNAAAQNKK